MSPAQVSARRESLRDFSGIAVSVAVGSLIWLAVLSLTRLSI